MSAGSSSLPLAFILAMAVAEDGRTIENPSVFPLGGEVFARGALAPLLNEGVGQPSNAIRSERMMNWRMAQCFKPGSSWRNC